MKTKRKRGNTSRYHKVCGKKRAYHSEEMAYYAKQSAERRGGEYHVYRCPYARHWHIAGGAG